MKLTRRHFLSMPVAALAAGAFIPRSAFGANDRIAVCVAGLRGRGGSHIEGYTGSKLSDLVALVDPDRHVLETRADQVASKTGKRPKTFTDIREALADDGIDAVSIATPNHWHSLMTIWACQAGKDVYVEKPLSHNVWEGRQLVEAAEKHGRIVQHGTQARSQREWLRDIKLLQSGEIIGPLYMARALCYKRRDALSFQDNSEPPAHLDWRAWQGPASEQAYNPNYVHYNWHWFWHYGNGDIGNQGVHQMDIAAWGMNRGLPVQVQSAGGRYGYDDPAETPNTLTSTLTYADGTMTVFEVRGRATNQEEGVGVGNLFYGSQGYYVQGKGFFNDHGRRISIDSARHPLPKQNDCYENFLMAVRDRDPGKIHGTALDGHVSSAHCHLANIAYRLGRTVNFDPATERCTGDEEANAMLTREYHEDYRVPETV